MNERKGQRFFFGLWVFDIDQAETILADHPREPVAANVADWARHYGLDSDEEGALVLFGRGSEFDPAYAMTTDLTRPLIIATLPMQHQNTALLIDGTHRLYRAVREGVSTLPALILTVQESAAIQI